MIVGVDEAGRGPLARFLKRGDSFSCQYNGKHGNQDRTDREELTNRKSLAHAQ